MSEKAIESSVCAWLAYQGYIPLKVGLEGWPDRCVILGAGRHVWMEFKTPEGKLRPQQVNRIAKLHEIGEVIYVVTSLEEAQHFIAGLSVSSPLSTYSDTKNRRP
jgi:VRR-NUC domain.